MGTHRRKWGWWLVMAIAVAVATSLLYRRCTTVPGGSSSSAPADSVLVVRDTAYYRVDGETVPVVTERPAEPAGGASASSSTSAPAPAETVVSIPVKDITSLIRDKSGRDINVTTKAPDHIDISYSGAVDIPLLGEQNVDFTAGFKVVEVVDDRMVRADDL